MTTSHAEARAHAQEIQEVTGVPVALHHNDTTPAEDAIGIFTKVALGSAGLGYALSSEKKTKEKKIADTAIGGASVIALLSALFDYKDIQDQKNESAEKLAQRVAGYLNRHPLYHITLIFHSQGADIGKRALRILDAFKDRINIVTIGGMVNISPSLAHRVVNFQNDGDMISHIAKFIFDDQKEIEAEILNGGNCGLLGCHASGKYLKAHPVQKALKEFSQPRYYLSRE
jgi:hypothetical protein